MSLLASCINNTKTTNPTIEDSDYEVSLHSDLGNNKIQEEHEDHEAPSPLDTILGEKILDRTTRKKRNDNFYSLLKIRTKDLQYYSTLYNVKRLDANHFVLTQKKDYAEARNFNILLRANDSMVTNYFVFNDFSISDIKQDEKNWIVLLSDFYQSNEYWQSEQQIKIIKLDSNLREIWQYNKNASIPLSGKKIRVAQDNYEFEIEVITGCHICYSLAELTLSKDGRFLALKSIGSENADRLSETELHEIFNIP